MNGDVVVVTDVTTLRAPDCGPYVEFAEIGPSPDPTRLAPGPVCRHVVKVHEFRGGVFGDGVRIAFGPRVAEMLGLPLQAIDENYTRLSEENERLRWAVGYLGLAGQSVTADLLRYKNATFWRRLKWAFTGGAI